MTSKDISLKKIMMILLIIIGLAVLAMFMHRYLQPHQYVEDGYEDIHRDMHEHNQKIDMHGQNNYKKFDYKKDESEK